MIRNAISTSTLVLAFTANRRGIGKSFARQVVAVPNPTTQHPHQFGGGNPEPPPPCCNLVAVH